MLGLGAADGNKGREVKAILADNQDRSLLIRLYFPGHLYREPLNKSRTPFSPVSLSLSAFCKKMLIQLPISSPRWAVPRLNF